ncbi:MAG TPA: hypothetical protein VMQ83_01345 [Gammaproteobacteria bacterium]|nr:hypothetical protein [Gammaproteobacteria bacterium]
MATTRYRRASLHLMYPGTALYRRMSDHSRLTVHDWDLYDTRHAVFRPARMSAEQLESGYRWAYHEFYRWRSIGRGASAHGDLMAGLRHLAYAAGWKKFEPLWDFIIRARRAGGAAAGARDDPERIRQTPTCVGGSRQSSGGAAGA